MNEENLIKYYNKFYEERRLSTRHGQIEYITTMKYIHKYIDKIKNPKIIDIGAGTGKYSIALSNEGYDVTAVELVLHNLRVIESKSDKVKTIHANAKDLKKIPDNEFDITLLMGPMYHLCTDEEKIQALKEANRITKKNGFIFVAYCMNDYCVIMHGFIDDNIKKSSVNKLLNDDFQIESKKDDLYSVVRLSKINEYNKIVNLERKKIITPDGPANYLRKTLNKMDKYTFKKFIEYHLKTCEMQEMIGAAAHSLDILQK